jgi:hypothetical protein
VAQQDGLESDVGGCWLFLATTDSSPCLIRPSTIQIIAFSSCSYTPSLVVIDGLKDASGCIKDITPRASGANRKP